MSETITKIHETVKTYNMLQEGDTVVVGVSGGADSMLLLDYLLNLSNCKLNLIVAHIEHGIRGEKSKADCEFVKDFCISHGLRFEMLSINAPEEAKEQGMGVEEYSRNRRYEFFNSFSPDKIAVAHNLSDSVETALFRIARGTSIKGLAGIPPVRDNIIRPLINCTSDEIRSTCKELGINYIVDETNADNEYSRNYIRNVIVPDFKKLNPSFEEAVYRLIQSSAEDDSFIENCADGCEMSGEGVSISKLRTLDVAVQKRIISKLAAKYGVSLDTLHLEKSLELLDASKKLQLKGDIYIASSGDLLRVYNQNEPQKQASLTLSVIDFTDFDRSKHKNMFADYDKVVGNLRLKEREAGDSISPADRGCTKSLKKLFNELKIPAENRNKLHIIADDLGIIAVAGLAVDERVKTDINTKKVILFNITTED
ncbi:MAG: tRNA lysidine(34) synthetase TilS [Eubacterium sp.]|nr:tRNA lysidine(34) synthetase TilS [Eubacterium sp.]